MPTNQWRRQLSHCARHTFWKHCIKNRQRRIWQSAAVAEPNILLCIGCWYKGLRVSIFTVHYLLLESWHLLPSFTLSSPVQSLSGTTSQPDGKIDPNTRGSNHPARTSEFFRVKNVVPARNPVCLRKHTNEQVLALKIPVVHVRVRWIMETRNYPACTLLTEG